jgi:hypothetical protein
LFEEVICFGEAKANDFIVGWMREKGGQRDGGYAVLLCQPFAKVQVGFVADAGIVVQLEVGAAAGDRPEARAGHGVLKAVAFLLVEIRKSAVFRGIGHEIGQGGLDGVVGGKHVELVHLSEFAREFRRSDAVAGFPAGVVVRFPEE